MILYHSVDHIMLKEEREGEWGERVSKVSYDKKSVDMAETLMVSNPLFGLCFFLFWGEHLLLAL